MNLRAVKPSKAMHKFRMTARVCDSALHLHAKAAPLYPAAHLCTLFAALKLVCNQLHSVLKLHPLSPSHAEQDSSSSRSYLSSVAAACTATARMRLEQSLASSSLLEICSTAC